MRAAVYETFGNPDVVRLAEMPAPTAGSNDVVVRVAATPVTSADARIRAAVFPRGFGVVSKLIFGRRRPRRPVLGGSFAGVIEAIGDGVAGFAVGQRVCGSTGLAFGTHAEMVVVPGRKLIAVPEGVSDAEAAGVIFGGSTALYFLRDLGALQPGSSLLVNGASGSVGNCAVQLGRLWGAEVTGVCSAANADLVRTLGATRVIDHNTTDVKSIPERFDLVFDTVGTLSLAAGRRLLAPRGRLLLAVADLADTIRARGDARSGSAPDRVEDVRYLLDLVAAGDLRVLIDQEFPLADIVDAHRLVDSHRKVGNVIIRP